MGAAIAATLALHACFSKGFDLKFSGMGMLCPMKSYGEHCPVPPALDVVGDRWALLVLREHELGPRRFTDLIDGLPGVGTNVLSARLRGLEAAGVIAKRTLPAPTRVTVYEATEAGRAIGPVLESLRDWGQAYGRPAARDDAVRASWMLKRLIRRPPQLAPGRVCELRVGDEVFAIRSDRASLTILGGGAERPRRRGTRRHRRRRANGAPAPRLARLRLSARSRQAAAPATRTSCPAA